MRGGGAEQSVDRASADLLEAAPDGMICVDHQGRTAGVTAAAATAFAYGRTELAAQPTELLVAQQAQILVPEETRRLHAGHRDRYLAQPRSRPMGAGMTLAGRRCPDRRC